MRCEVGRERRCACGVVWCSERKESRKNRAAGLLSRRSGQQCGRPGRPPGRRYVESADLHYDIGLGTPPCREGATGCTRALVGTTQGQGPAPTLHASLCDARQSMRGAECRHRLSSNVRPAPGRATSTRRRPADPLRQDGPAQRAQLTVGASPRARLVR